MKNTRKFPDPNAVFPNEYGTSCFIKNVIKAPNISVGDYTYYDDDPVPPSDVWDDVSHLQQRDPQRTGYDTQKPLALLERIGLADKADEYPAMLSGGQKQRIAIAGILAMEPECIVLDEATAMLDPAGRCEVIDTVLRLNREQGITVVLITHHMVEAERADRVIVMNDGEVAMDGMPRQVFSQVERLHELGLAAPDTVELLYRLRQDGVDVPLESLTVGECADTICRAFGGAEGK